MHRIVLVILGLTIVDQVELFSNDNVKSTIEHLSKSVEQSKWDSVFENCTVRAKRQIVEEFIELGSSINSQQLSEFVEGVTTVELLSSQLSMRPLLIDDDAFMRVKVGKILEAVPNERVCRMLQKMSKILDNECTFGSKLDAMNGDVVNIERCGDKAICYLVPRKKYADTLVGLTSTVPKRVRLLKINGEWKFDGFVDGLTH